MSISIPAPRASVGVAGCVLDMRIRASAEPVLSVGISFSAEPVLGSSGVGMA